MFGGQVTMYLPVQHHSIFSPFHNVPTPPFYYAYNYKISTLILCIKQCFCEHLAIHVICFYTRTFSGFKQDCRNCFMPEKV